MALCNICIDLQGWGKCRKIAWSNRGHHIPVDYVGKGREQERKLFRQSGRPERGKDSFRVFRAFRGPNDLFKIKRILCQ
jgi:hypothetical protein